MRGSFRRPWPTCDSSEAQGQTPGHIPIGPEYSNCSRCDPVEFVIVIVQ